MCKKKDFPVVMNVFLAFFITLAVTIFNLAANNNLNVPALVVGMVYGFCLNLTLETLIDLPAFGNFFVKAFHLKMESIGAYFVRIFFIVLLLVLLMSSILMFCEVGFLLGTGFFGFWITKVPAIFLVAYITALIFFPLCIKGAQALCTRD